LHPKKGAIMVFGGETRARAIHLVVKGKKRKGVVAEMFGMNRRTLYTWIEIYKKEGRTEPITTRTGPGKRRKLDPQKFQKFLDQNKSMTIKQMTEALGVGKSAVATAMRAIEYTRKKNNSYTKSVTKKNDKSFLKK
jgi:putative transposase